MEILARLGVGMLVVPQKPWHVVERDLATYRELYLEVNGTAAPRSTLAGWVFCDEDESRACELGRRYIGAYYESVLAHYELMGRTFEGRRGYELYAEMAGRLREAGEERAVEFFVDLNVCGTPEQCFEQILEGGRHVDNDRFIGVFSYGNMPAAEGERNMRLFAAEVLPRLQAVEAHAA
jgi:alkanesulfonate monooxygenase SsuD/methylene tetrahydromethanopterin reductase-like flavin-dependent oxidoreductase (luciferase family)